MAIDTNIHPAGRPRPDTQRPDLPAQAQAGKLGSSADAASARAKERASLNSAVVQSNLTASLSAGNEPLALLFKTAIEKLNEILEADLGENAIQNAMGQDNSPEATAERIVSLSTGFFEAFKEQHADEEPDAVLDKFMETIRSGFEQGFKEAQDILDGLGVLSGDVAAGINKTYELVLQGYADFEDSQRGPADEQNTEETA